MTADPEDAEDSDYEVLLSAVAHLDGAEADDQNRENVVFSETEAQEILLAMVKDKKENRHRTFHGAQKAKKNRDLARGYGAGRDGHLRPGSYKVSIQEIQKRTRCKDKKEVNFLEEQHEEIDFYYLEKADVREIDKGSIEELREADFVDLGTGTSSSSSAVHFLSMTAESMASTERAEISSAREVYRGVPVFPCFRLRREPESEGAFATLDTGCQRMAIGSMT